MVEAEREHGASRALLKIASDALSVARAQREVASMLTQLGRPLEWAAEPTRHIDVPRLKGGHDTLSVGQLLAEARAEGVVNSVQGLIDQADPLFGGTFEMATNSRALNMSMTYLHSTLSIQGPGRIAPIEGELADDILWYRRDACTATAHPDLVAATRSYRGYLQSCITLVEAFINRYAFHLTHKKHPRAAELSRITSMAERLELWADICARTRAADLRKGVAWCHFSELRRERNEVVHAADVHYAYSIDGMMRHMNYAQTGVGGLLIRLRELERRPALGFMKRIAHAPQITAS